MSCFCKPVCFVLKGFVGGYNNNYVNAVQGNKSGLLWEPYKICKNNVGKKHAILKLHFFGIDSNHWALKG